jgi:hypothetical protein
MKGFYFQYMGDNDLDEQLRHLKLSELTIIARDLHIRYIKVLRKI